MAIEIIPKKKEEKVSSIGILAWYTGLILLFLSVLSVVLFLILTWRTSQTIEEVRAEIEAKKSPEILLLESEMRGHYRRVSDFAYILNERTSPDPMLGVIERTIHPEVHLSDLQINVAGRTIRANGVAANITAFDQQVRLLEREAMIVDTGIDSFTRRDDGRITFPMTLVFNRELFNSDN